VHSVVIFDHGEKLVCCLFLSGPPCLQAIVICVKIDQLEFTQIQSIGFDWRYMYDNVRYEIQAIQPIFGKEEVRMYVVDSTTFFYGLLAGCATYKTYIFGDDDMVVTSSTLLLFFIEPSLAGVLRINYETFLQMFPLSSLHYCTVSNVEMMLLLCPQAQACEESCLVCSCAWQRRVAHI